MKNETIRHILPFKHTVVNKMKNETIRHILPIKHTVVGDRENRLNETVILSIHSRCFG